MNKKNDKFINFKTNHLKEESKNFEVKPISDTINEENLLKFNNFGLINRSESNNNLNNKYISKNSNNLTGSTNNPNSGSGIVNYSKIESESSRMTNDEFRKIREGFSFGRLQYLSKDPQRDGIVNSKVKIGGTSSRTKKSEINEFIYQNKYSTKKKFNYNKKENKKENKKSFEFDYSKKYSKYNKYNKYGFKY